MPELRICAVLVITTFVACVIHRPEIATQERNTPFWILDMLTFIATLILWRCQRLVRSIRPWLPKTASYPAHQAECYAAQGEHHSGHTNQPEKKVLVRVIEHDASSPISELTPIKLSVSKVVHGPAILRDKTAVEHANHPQARANEPNAQPTAAPIYIFAAISKEGLHL
jgi:hypothetical protein